MTPQSNIRAYFALCAVCFFWGTTYLGMRMALESFTPALLVGTRYLLSGGILTAAAWLTKKKLPRGRELWLTALYGAIILGIGSGSIAFAETWIPSGLAALFITTASFWMVGAEALLPGGERLHGPTIAGMLVGLAGTVLLVSQSARHAPSTWPVISGFLILQIGCAGWSFGSVAHKRLETTVHSVVSGGIQQLGAGVAFSILGIFMDGLHIRWSARGMGALAYLVIAGSIIGYSAYAYALDRLPIALVSIYTYVNPVVAVFLGWLVYREPFGIREGLAMLMIFAGVALVKRFSVHAARADQEVRKPALASNACSD